MDRTLPPQTLGHFPVQFFSQRELPQASALASSRRGQIWFGDSFGRSRGTMAGTTPHRAIDIFAPRGLPIFAAVSGLVPWDWTVYVEVSPGVRAPRQVPGIGTVAAMPTGDGGNYVITFDTVSNRHYYYAHLNAPPLVSVGQRVDAGQLLGYVGNTGRLAQHTDPHLHFQVTTRPGGGVPPPLTFWNPFDNLVDIAAAIGGQRRGGRVEIEFSAFLQAVQLRLGRGITDPWTGAVTPDLRNPWDVAF